MDLPMSNRSNSSHHDGGGGDQTSRAGSSSIPPPGQQSEVLLSFKGETLGGFPKRLHRILVNAGFLVSGDKKGLLVGENGENELLEEIKPFKILILITQQNYASDGSCLKELLQILKYKKRFGQLVLLIFHGVKPSDLQKLLDLSEKEPRACKRRRLEYEYFGDVRDWKLALREVSDLTKLKFEERDERELVEIVADKVLEAQSTLVVSDDLVGSEDHMGTIINMVNVEGYDDGPSKSSRLTSSQQGMKYSVFLNFRGSDTRKNFTSILYKKLQDAGIDVYMDDKEIRASAVIHRSLMEAIENSTIAVPIFSKDYASSKSCLRELRKIYECRNRVKQIVLPIFYFIEPSDVGNQTGQFKRSFDDHQKKGVSSQKLNDWREALKEIGDLKGHTISEDENQGEIINKIALNIIDLLGPGGIHLCDNLVGIDPQVQEVVEKLEVSSKNVKILGICGMSGVGKTTLAKVVYNKLLPRYEYNAFISDIEGRYPTEGPYELQNQLISQLLKREYARCSLEENKKFIRHRFSNVKALIVLDNVQCLKHVEAFADDFLGFGLGSIIIVTTRTPKLIDNIGKDAMKYKMQLLNDSDSLKLLCLHAFGKDFPMQKYDEMSREISYYTGGHPAILKVVGCCLYNKKEEGIWKETLQILKDNNLEEMQSFLSKCYDEDLDKFEKQIFLDVACFLEWKSKTIAHYMWDSCGVYPIKGVDKLIHLSLLKIGKNDELLMTYPVRNFGKERVKEENPKGPALCSRLWSHDEALNALKEKGPKEKIQAICLRFDNSLTGSLTNEEFDGLSALRFLRLHKAKISGDFKNLFPELRWLDLKDCSDTFEELKHLSLKKLVILDISQSKIKQEWQGWKLIMEDAKDLKVLVLANCDDLRGSPTFRDGMRLERLSFQSCPRLRRINMVSNALESLVHLNLKCCPDINVLPEGSLEALKVLIIDGTSLTEINATTFRMKNLETLSASRCKKLTTIDKSIGNLKSLTCLTLDDTAIRKLPSSIGSLPKLQNLSLRNCRELHALPKSIGKLSSLTRMDMSDTTIKRLPTSIKRLKGLKVLYVRNTHIEEFPKSITKLEKLEEIDFSMCQRMEGTIPDGITNLSSLTTLLLSETAISSLPDDISGFSSLQVLNLWDCKGLKNLPRLPTSLTTLHVGSRELKKMPGQSNLKELVELYFADNMGPPQNITNDGNTKPWSADRFQWIADLPKLETLELHISKITELPVNFSAHNKLRKLVLSCPQLQSLPELPPSLTNLHLQYCKSITEYESLSSLTLLSELQVYQCGGGSIDLKNLGKLRHLDISDGDLKKLRGIEELHHLRKLKASNCLIQGNLSVLEERGTLVDVYKCEWKTSIREDSKFL